MRSRVSRVTQTCFHYLRRMRAIRRQLGSELTARLVKAAFHDTDIDTDNDTDIIARILARNRACRCRGMRPLQNLLCRVWTIATTCWPRTSDFHTGTTSASPAARTVLGRTPRDRVTPALEE